MTTKQPEFLRIEGEDGYLAYVHDKHHNLTKEGVTTILREGGYNGDFEIVSKPELQSRPVTCCPAPNIGRKITQVYTY
jgi:hypothetical protein